MPCPSWCDPESCRADVTGGSHWSKPTTVEAPMTGTPSLALAWWYPGDQPTDHAERFRALALVVTAASGGRTTHIATHEVTAGQLREFSVVAARFADETDAAREMK